MMRGASCVEIGVASVLGTSATAVDCTVASGFATVTMSVAPLPNSTVELAAYALLSDTSAAVFASCSDAFLSTRTELVGDFFFGGRCADGTATSESTGVGAASLS